MAEYVYGIVASGGQAPSRPGIGGVPLRLLEAGPLAALASELEDREPELGREELLVHAGVLEAALAEGTVLPMRFGTVMASAEDVRERLLVAHADELSSELQRLDGKVELRVRADYDQDALLREIVSADRDIARLRERLQGAPTDATYYQQIELGEMVSAAIERTRERDTEELVRALSQNAEAVDVAPAPHERVAFSGSFLVDRKRVREFDEELERVARAQAARLRVKETGPLPPHSFVELGMDG